MDPATIIGTTSAILGIVGVVAKSITTLSDLRDRFQNINLEVSSLITQLSSLKAALTKISEWIQSDLTYAPQHYQLVMDLTDAIVSCRLLVQSLDNHIGCLKRKDDGSLALSSGIQIILHTSSFRDLQTFIDRQIGALNLLLTACNCKSLSEQKTWLEDLDNRAVLNQSRDDSSSLIVLYDSSSLFSRATISTGTSTKWSIEFPFDSILMKSKVYQRTIRGLLRSNPSQHPTASDRLRKREVTIGALSQARQSKEAAIRSKHIEVQIKRDRLSAMHRIELLMTGTSDIDLQVIFWRLKYSNNDILDDNLKPLLGIIITAFEDFQQRLKSGEIEFGLIGERVREVPSRLPNILSTESLENLLPPVPSDLNIKEQLEAIDGIWRRAPENIKAATDPILRSVLQDLRNILVSNKRPSNKCLVEIARLHQSTHPTTLEATTLHNDELDLHNGQLNLHITKVVCPLSKKWLHQFANVNAIAFVVDSQSLYKSTSDGQSLILENLEHYKQLVNHELFKSTSIILILANMDAFRNEFRLFHANVTNVFPQFNGGDDWVSGVAFLVDQLCSISAEHTDRSTYSYYEENTPGDQNLERFIRAAMNDIIIVRSMRWESQLSN